MVPVLAGMVAGLEARVFLNIRSWMIMCFEEAATFLGASVPACR